LNISTQSTHSRIIRGSKIKGRGTAKVHGSIIKLTAAARVVYRPIFRGIHKIYVFGINIPEAAHSSWIFIQRAVYQVAEFDALTTRIQELLIDLNC